ncbi:MAG: hypothetical protein V2I56_09310 [Desulfobacteraceae bacterium]|jgi:hypothetical protein|nr:hypothetical protein [Desulfobacteraceae bacterium]
MMAEKTRFDYIFVKIKNNPVLAIIIALGAIAIHPENKKTEKLYNKTIAASPFLAKGL